MLRTLALVLLLANALLAAALSGLFDSGHGEREPGRLQRQHQPGLVRVLGPQAASAALEAAQQAAAAASNAQAAVCRSDSPPGLSMPESNSPNRPDENSPPPDSKALPGWEGLAVDMTLRLGRSLDDALRRPHLHSHRNRQEFSI